MTNTKVIQTGLEMIDKYFCGSCKEELKKTIIEWTVGILILVTGICLMGFILWIIGKGQGKW